MNKKVLIMSMTGGFGHIRAGAALLDYTKEHFPNMEAEHVDVVDIDTSLKKYSHLYDIVSKKFPFIWKIIYTYRPIFFILQKFVNARASYNRAIFNYVAEKNPDAIIFTNAIILSMFADAYKKKFPHVLMGIVVTDYHGHPYYRSPSVDYYFVPTLQVQKDLEVIGIKKEKIVVTGIPINPRFYQKVNVEELKLKYGIKNTMPVILFIASFKISKHDLLAVINQLLEPHLGINLVFIANGNEAFYQLAKDNFSSHERFSLVKWTDVIDEYMKLADVIISKAGGLTVSECISLQKPLIMVNPIPGQEEYNAKFVQENKLGKKVNHINEIIDIVPEIILSAKNKHMDFGLQKNPCEKIFQTIC